jgi:hypothetical protein
MGSGDCAASLAECIEQRQWPRSRADCPRRVKQFLELLKSRPEGIPSEFFIVVCADAYSGAR